MMRTDWKVGEKVYFQMLNRKREQKPGVKDVDMLGTFLYSVEVLSDDGQGHGVHRWRMEAFRLPASDTAGTAASTAVAPQVSSAAPAATSSATSSAASSSRSMPRDAQFNIEDRRVQELIQRAMSIPTDVRVGDEGDALEVVNLPFIREQVAELFERLLRAPDGPPSAERIGLRAMMDRMLLNDAWLTQMLTEQIGLAYAPKGSEYQPGEVLEHTVMLPLTFIQGSIPGPTKLQVSPLRPDGTISVNAVTDLPTEQFVAAVSEFLSSTMLVGVEEKHRKGVMSALQSAQYAIRLDHTFVLREGDSWPVTYRSERRVTGAAPGGKLEQIQAIELTRLAERPTPEELSRDGLMTVSH